MDNSFTNITDFLADSISNYNIEGIKVAIANGADVWGRCLEFRKYYNPLWKPHIWYVDLTGEEGREYIGRNFIFNIMSYTPEEVKQILTVVEYLRSVGSVCAIFHGPHITKM